MNFLVFDTETTGLGAHDEVIQFAGFLLNENLAPIKLYNFYCDTQQEISEGAYKVHQISKAKLKELSGGYTFEDNFYKLLDYIRELDVCWVAYNCPFDRRLINQTLKNNGLPQYNFGKELNLLSNVSNVSNFCLLKAMRALLPGYKHNLSTVVKTLPWNEDDIKKAVTVLMSKLGINGNVGYHDAIYDAYCTTLLLKQYHTKLRG